MRPIVLCFAAAFSLAHAQSVDPRDPHALAGTAAIERGDFKTAVAELETAVTANPKVSSYHNNLAFAYFQLGNEPKGWFHLRQAVLLNSENIPAVKSFESFWDHLEKTGVVKLGKGREELVSALGTPDLEVRTDDEVWLIWGLKRIILRNDAAMEVTTWVKQ